MSSDRHSQTLGSYLVKAQEIKHLPAAFDSGQSPLGPRKTEKKKAPGDEPCIGLREKRRISECKEAATQHEFP